MRLSHTATFYRHRVVVWLRSGERIEARFLDRSKTHITVELENGSERRIHKRSLRKMTPVGVGAHAQGGSRERS